MGAYLWRRAGASLLLLYLVLTATFFAVRLAPGDPIATLVTEGTPASTIESLETYFGFDRPLHEQYFLWLKNLLQGDLGTSIKQGRSVATILLEALPATFLLGFAALLIEFSVAIILGVAAARRHGSWIDRVTRGLSLAVFSTPGFWLAIMATTIFSGWLGWFPSSGARSYDGGGLLDRLHHLILPALVLGLPPAGATLGFVRNRMLEVLGEDYIRTARAKGLSERQVVWRHALPNAIGPLIQLFGTSLPALLNGVLVLEILFGWPGLGRVAWGAIQDRDYPLILATTALSAVLVVIGSFLADVLQRLIDPRTRGQA